MQSSIQALCYLWTHSQQPKKTCLTRKGWSECFLRFPYTYHPSLPAMGGHSSCTAQDTTGRTEVEQLWGKVHFYSVWTWSFKLLFKKRGNYMAIPMINANVSAFLEAGLSTHLHPSCLLPLQASSSSAKPCAFTSAGMQSHSSGIKMGPSDSEGQPYLPTTETNTGLQESITSGEHTEESTSFLSISFPTSYSSNKKHLETGSWGRVWSLAYSQGNPRHPWRSVSGFALS